MRAGLASCCLVVGWLASGCPSQQDGPPALTGTCPGQVQVSRGLLAGGSAGQAIATSGFSALGSRVLLVRSIAEGCALETSLGSSASPTKSASIRLKLAPGLGPGTYQLSADAGAAFSAEYSFSSPYYGGYADVPQSGTLTLVRVDSSEGIQGTYHLDFGGGGISGGGPNGTGSLGELVEDGAFEAPLCELCDAAPTCGAASCAPNQVCVRSCDGAGRECAPAPSCTGAPSCGNCDLPSASLCGSTPGGGCEAFDGRSLICGCFP